MEDNSSSMAVATYERNLLRSVVNFAMGSLKLLIKSTPLTVSKSDNFDAEILAAE